MGSEWLAQSLCDLPDREQMELMMLLWRCWHVRNELTHDKKPPPVEASCRFLLSYVESIIGTQNKPEADPVKGKQTVEALHTKVTPTYPPKSNPTPARWTPPAGWAKLNVDGSFCPSTGAAGATMVLRVSLSTMIFKEIRHPP